MNRDLTPEFLRSILDYDPSTGLLTWRDRTEDMFLGCASGAEARCKSWNSRFGGMVAGSPPDKCGRKRIRILGRPYFQHRIIWRWMTGEWPDEVDHINLDPADNRWVNLREATRSQNNMNRRHQERNSIGFKGVTKATQAKTFCARIQANGEVFRLGNFATPQEAHAAYVEASQKLHGEFRRVSKDE
jgi:hypothetical protein